MSEQNQGGQNRPAGMDTWIRRRKTYIVDRSMQYTYIAMVVSMVLVMIVGIAVSNVFLIWMYNRILVEKYNQVPGDWKNDIWLFLLADTTIVILLVIAAVFYSVLHSHRIAGPIYRLKQSILRLQTGDFNFAVTFRQKDFLKDMAEEMNKFIAGLQSRNDEMRKVRTRLDELGKRMQGSGAASDQVAEVTDLSNQVAAIVAVKDSMASVASPAQAAAVSGPPAH